MCVPGDRAEGAEATLEASLSKLTFTAAQEQEEDQGEGQDPDCTGPELSSPTAILLLNSIWWTFVTFLKKETDAQLQAPTWTQLLKDVEVSQGSERMKAQAAPAHLRPGRHMVSH